MSTPDPSLSTVLFSGPHSAAELCRLLKISQPTCSRRLKALGDQVLDFGGYRERRYALRRSIRGRDRFPLFRVTAGGQLEHWGVLHPVRPEGFVLVRPESTLYNRWYPGLPWWLLDMTPQGFLGRAFAREHAQRLGLPSELTLWQDDHVMLAIGAAGEDVVGNLLIGEAAREQWLARELPTALPQAELPARYRAMAQRALGGEVVGPSAGGEQPKFAAYVETDHGPRHVLVKFTANQDNPVTQRWKNLLACEHLALALLRKAGLPAAQSRIHDHEGQRFLEVQRFDRVGAEGRLGLVSLTALDAEYVGKAAKAWPAMTRVLMEQGIIAADDHALACRLTAFGIMIGNGDMHNGNLSFLHDGSEPYTLAPTYDMLPMALAPRTSGEIPEVKPAVLTLGPAKSDWSIMLPLARQYWQEVDASTLIDVAFRDVVRQMLARLDLIEQQIARLA